MVLIFPSVREPQHDLPKKIKHVYIWICPLTLGRGYSQKQYLDLRDTVSGYKKYVKDTVSGYKKYITDTVSGYKKYLTDTVSVNKKYITDTESVNKEYVTDTVSILSNRDNTCF